MTDAGIAGYGSSPVAKREELFVRRSTRSRAAFSAIRAHFTHSRDDSPAGATPQRLDQVADFRESVHCLRNANKRDGSGTSRARAIAPVKFPNHSHDDAYDRPREVHRLRRRGRRELRARKVVSWTNRHEVSPPFLLRSTGSLISTGPGRHGECERTLSGWRVDKRSRQLRIKDWRGHGAATPGTKWHWTSPPPRDQIRRVRPRMSPTLPFFGSSLLPRVSESRPSRGNATTRRVRSLRGSSHRAHRVLAGASCVLHEARALKCATNLISFQGWRVKTGHSAIEPDACKFSCVCLYSSFLRKRNLVTAIVLVVKQLHIHTHLSL